MLFPASFVSLKSSQYIAWTPFPNWHLWLAEFFIAKEWWCKSAAWRDSLRDSLQRTYECSLAPSSLVYLLQTWCFLSFPHAVSSNSKWFSCHGHQLSHPIYHKKRDFECKYLMGSSHALALLMLYIHWNNTNADHLTLCLACHAGTLQSLLKPKKLLFRFPSLFTFYFCLSWFSCLMRSN